MSTCPCGTGSSLTDCCGPYLDGSSYPETAEALMRSRYSAFATVNIAHLQRTTSTDKLATVDLVGTEKWARERDWTKLEIIETEDGQAQDETGIVEFIAHFTDKGYRRQHHERSTFIREDGRWVFDGGEVAKPKTATAEAKVGRNDPCSCGSGKKFKKCCG